MSKKSNIKEDKYWTVEEMVADVMSALNPEKKKKKKERENETERIHLIHQYKTN